jgi:hypothetical protein
MSEHGIIIEWDDDRGWGTIRLDPGVVLRFSHNACGKGVRCAVGTEIGQRRATSVQRDAEATLTPLDVAKRGLSSTRSSRTR